MTVRLRSARKRASARPPGRRLRASCENAFGREPPSVADSLSDPNFFEARRPQSEGDVKELRVKIDVSYHLKLHALKLLRNKKMSDAIEEALDHYFEHVVNEQQQLEGVESSHRLF